MSAAANSRKQEQKRRQRHANRLLALGSAVWIAGVAIVWLYTWPPTTQVYDAAYYAGQRDCRARYAGNYERVERCIALFNLQYLRSRNGHAISGLLVALFPPLLGWFAIHIRGRMQQ
ncbi:hypothetical protein [Oceanibaculum sp.]|uniref:hypothetical protein n=1 Tax=Oceanibaculum sp. TaxID=1903597 RepID=UPI00258663DC|nr:hypothetical protein [Oceanibaculum sp.]MCH2393691.1 hypothetical protein [Oceanibaculum sp.]